jgi:thiol-disulfide isomerase/thioredoxin
VKLAATCSGTFAAIALTTAIVLFLSGPTQDQAFASESARPGLLQVEMLPDAPNFILKTTEGKSIQLKEFKGKAVLLNFWATWCVPCREEMSWLVAFQKQYGPQGLVVLGLAMDQSSLTVRKFLRKSPVNYPVLMSSQEVADRFFVKGLPTSIYIDANGRITDQVPGSSPRTVMENEIKLALENAKAGKR